MRLPMALVLTILTVILPVLSANASPKLIRVLPLRADPPGSSSSSSSISSTPTTTTSTSSTSTSTSTPSSTSSTTSTESTTTSTTISTPPTSSSSSQSSPSSFSTSASFTSAAQPSSSQEPTSSSQSTQLIFSTSSSVVSDTTSTSDSSRSRTTFLATASDGSLHTVTAVISTPSDGSGLGSVSTAKQGFFANTGAVAGTFLVVGLIGTGVLICVFLWALRRYRRHRSYQKYFDDEYREFNRNDDRGTTPEATLPAIARDSTFDTPTPSSPAFNMIEKLHGNETAVPNVYFDSAQYQAQPGEFNPYQTHGGAYAYSDDHADYGQYPGSSQQGTIAYAYQPEMDTQEATGQYQADAGLSHAPEGAVSSQPQVGSNHEDTQTH